jgi:hypothetical protein
MLFIRGIIIYTIFIHDSAISKALSINYEAVFITLAHVKSPTHSGQI